MLLEETEGEAESGSDAAVSGLRALISDARELDRSLSSAPIPEHAEHGAAEGEALRSWLGPRVEKLSANLPQIISAAPKHWVEDLNKIRHAIDRLEGLEQNRTESAAVPRPRGKASAFTSQAKGEHLLVVDDNDENQDILRHHLERQGYRATTARSGQECLELLANTQFDLVLLDVIMPVTDGFEVLKRMKSAPALRETPVIMISALDESSSVVRCIQMGAEDYLMKPFDPVLLNARIGASLEKKRLRDEEKRRTEELQLALDKLSRTQDQLVVQEKLASLGALTAGIAHEIKNPLNFVTNFASLSRELIEQIQEQLSQGESASESLAELDRNLVKIEEHGKRADRIVRGMLMHSRGKSGAREWVDVNLLLNESANLAFHGLRAVDRSFNVCIDSELDPEAGQVRAVPQDLSRVFLNIINNAYYAAHERKKTSGETFRPLVTIGSRNLGAKVEVRIRDNGAGVPEQVLSKIFNPFFTTKPAGAGTGLGLSISHDIVVRGHQGELRVESEPEKFTEFIVTLPRESA